MKTTAIMSGGRPLFQQRDRGHICVSTTAAISVMWWQTQQHQTTMTMDILKGPVGNVLQLPKSVEVGGNDMRY
jgi:hypothetical protein